MGYKEKKENKADIYKHMLWVLVHSCLHRQLGFHRVSVEVKEKAGKVGKSNFSSESQSPGAESSRRRTPKHKHARTRHVVPCALHGKDKQAAENE